MHIVKFEWENMHAFLVMRYQVHGHASFDVMHAKRFSMEIERQQISSKYGCIYRTISVLYINCRGDQVVQHYLLTPQK
jgi:hypothetical protein